MVDRKAQKLLFQRFWCSHGWQDNPLSQADFEYAKSHGLMFDDVLMDHDTLVARLIERRDAIDPIAVGRAFLASLSTRRLDLRSALGSFAVARFFPEHRFQVSASDLLPSGNRMCNLCCYVQLQAPEPLDLNILSFERCKFGGVRHDDLEYMWFDLWRFSETPLIEPVAEDFAIMRGILDVLSQIPKKERLSVAIKTLSGALKSNASERRVLCDILALAGILQPKAYPSYLDGYVAPEDRIDPDLHFNDFRYPAGLWHGADGINQDALNFWFPGLNWSA